DLVLEQAHVTDDATVAASQSGVGATIPPLPLTYRAIALDDWPEANRQMQKSYDAANKPGAPVQAYVTTFFVPWLALTDAMVGKIADAETLIAKTPLDCYRCVIVRAKIAELKHDTPAADGWFGAAVKLAPSIPFAYSDWGATLLRRRDHDGAIAKFEKAH